MISTLIQLAPTIATILFFLIFCYVTYAVFKKGTKKKFDKYSKIPLAGVFNDWRSGDSDPVFGMLDLRKKEFQLDSLNGFDYLESFSPKNSESGRKERLY